MQYDGELDRLRADVIRAEMKKISGRIISLHSAHEIARSIRNAERDAGLFNPLTGERQ